MKVFLTLVADDGKKYRGEAHLQVVSESEAVEFEASKDKATDTSMDFSLNERTFGKRYGNQLSGPQVFALLVAYLAKGNVDHEVSISDVMTLWGRLTSVFGQRFNAKYPTMAKEYGWVDSRKRGFYTLVNGWKDLFQAA